MARMSERASANANMRLRRPLTKKGGGRRHLHRRDAQMRRGNRAREIGPIEEKKRPVLRLRGHRDALVSPRQSIAHSRRHWGGGAFAAFFAEAPRAAKFAGAGGDPCLARLFSGEAVAESARRRSCSSVA